MAAEGVAGDQVAVAAEAAEDDVVAGHRDGRIDEVDEPDADQCRDLQIRGQPWHQRRQEVDVAVAAADHRRDVVGRGRAAEARSEERRVGEEWGSTCRSRWSPYP